MLLCSVHILRTEFNKTGKLVLMAEPFTNLLPFSSQFTFYCPASIIGTFLLPAGTVLSFLNRGHWRDSRERIFSFSFQCTPQRLILGHRTPSGSHYPSPVRWDWWGTRSTKGTKSKCELHLKCWALGICPDLVLAITSSGPTHPSLNLSCITSTGGFLVSSTRTATPCDRVLPDLFPCWVLCLSPKVLITFITRGKAIKTQLFKL